MITYIKLHLHIIHLEWTSLTGTIANIAGPAEAESLECRISHFNFNCSLGFIQQDSYRKIQSFFRLVGLMDQQIDCTSGYKITRI